MTDTAFLQKQKEIEAILFTMGDSVEASTIMEALELSEEAFDDIMAALMKKYEDEASGIQIIRLENAYQMCTKRECYEALIKVASTPVRPNLTGVMLEVLSIVAYKQPVTRGEIERIRGVSSDYAVNRLLEYGLIEEDGRAETIGRPILFKTSEIFLRQFGLTSASDLPVIDEEAMDLAKEKAYLEAGVTEEEYQKLRQEQGMEGLLPEEAPASEATASDASAEEIFTGGLFPEEEDSELSGAVVFDGQTEIIFTEEENDETDDSL